MTRKLKGTLTLSPAAEPTENNTLYVDSTTNDLKWKDSGGNASAVIPEFILTSTKTPPLPEYYFVRHLASAFNEIALPNNSSAGRAGVVLYNGKIYVTGGFDSDGVSNRLQIYDIATDTWTDGANMTTERYGHVAQVVNNKIYVISGHDGSDYIKSIEEYDIAADTWTTMTAESSEAGVDFSSGVYNGKIYCARSKAYSYDPSTDTWTTLADKPTVIGWGQAGGLYDGKLYCFGGNDGVNHYKNTEIYDIATNTWSAGTDAPDEYLSWSACTIDDEGVFHILGGGDKNADNPLVVHRLYVPSTDSWSFSEITLPIANLKMSAVFFEKSIFLSDGKQDPKTYRVTKPIYVYGKW